jgi:hypothetical protein
MNAYIKYGIYARVLSTHEGERNYIVCRKMDECRLSG